MRVGYVVKRYPRYSETFIVNEIIAHEAAGLDIRIFALLPPEDTHFQDIIAKVRAPVKYLSARSGKSSELWSTLTRVADALPNVWQQLSAGSNDTAKELILALALAHDIREQGITHLHAHFATTATAVARLAANFASISYTFTAHANDIFHRDTNLPGLHRKFTDAAAAITVSDYNIDYLENTLGIDHPRLQRIYNGLDLERFVYQDPDVQCTNIITVGRLVEKKGFCYLIDACRILKTRRRKFDCRIIGTGPLKNELQEQINKAKLNDQVSLCGPRPQQEVINEIRSAAIFAAPCIVGDDGNRDGLPTVLLEAMALGTPCISTDVTGIPEIIRNNDTGLIVRQGDPVTLADALEAMLDDTALRKKFARNSRNLIERNFDINRNAAVQRDCFIAACKHQTGMVTA